MQLAKQINDVIEMWNDRIQAAEISPPIAFLTKD